MKDKKAQHEIVGFVLIIVIVAVVGLILLSLMIGQDGAASESSEVSNLIQASMYHTSDCAVSFVPQYRDINELIKSCYNNQRCLDDRHSCEVLESELESVIGNALEIGSDSVNKAYKIRVISKTLESEDAGVELIPLIESGSFEGCSSSVGASYSVAVGKLSPAVVDVEVEVCKG